MWLVQFALEQYCMRKTPGHGPGKLRSCFWRRNSPVQTPRCACGDAARTRNGAVAKCDAAAPLRILIVGFNRTRNKVGCFYQLQYWKVVALQSINGNWVRRNP